MWSAILLWCMLGLNYESIPDMFLSPGVVREWWRQTREQFKIDPEVSKASLQTVVGHLLWVLGATLIFNLLVAYIFYTPDPIFIFFMTLVIFPLVVVVCIVALTLKNTWSQPDFSKSETAKELINQNRKNLEGSPPTIPGREGR